MASAPPRQKQPPLSVVRGDAHRQRATAAGRVNPVLLWFGVLGGPVAFGLVRVAGLILVSGRCLPAAQSAALFGLSSSQERMAAVTVLAALVAGAAGIASWHAWHQARLQAEGQSGESLSQAPFWALGGLFLSCLFFVLILFTGVLAIGLATPCAS